MSDIATIAELQIRRRNYIKLINANTQRACAFVVRGLGFDPNANEEARAALWNKATKIVAKAFAGKGCDMPEVETDLEVIGQSIVPLDKQLNGIKLTMCRMARKLPVHPWVKSVRGFGDLGLAVIVGEAGDLANYPGPCALRKRLGLAPFVKAGVGHSAKQWRLEGGLSAEDWTAYGYVPRRRAEMWAVIADPLFRQQTMITGPYRQKYDARRAHTAVTHPDWTKGHSHQDALRIMTQELLVDLWCVWNGRAKALLLPSAILPSQSFDENGEAGEPLLPNQCLPPQPFTGSAA